MSNKSRAQRLTREREGEVAGLESQAASAGGEADNMFNREGVRVSA